VDIRAQYRRFKRWQLNPFDYEFTSQATNHCSNCDHDFVGNYCPYCSQKSGLGPITWRSVLKSIGEVWGMHNRSLGYSVLQLFLRPGYFIGDYIQGKRQVSFPPVKMLAIIAVIGVVVDFLTGAIYGVFRINPEEKMAYITNVFSWLNDHFNGAFPPPSDFLNDMLRWLNTHPDVLSLVMLSFLIVPNFFIFRFAPRNTRHTIPQGFFIQVFSTVVFLILNMIYDITSMGWLVFIMAGLLLFLTYKQLFGYGVWGTLWRLVLAFVCGYASWSVLLNLSYGIHLLKNHQHNAATSAMLNIPIALALIAVILCICYLISKPKPSKSNL